MDAGVPAAPVFESRRCSLIRTLGIAECWPSWTAIGGSARR
jgi:hypothetical protein